LNLQKKIILIKKIAYFYHEFYKNYHKFNLIIPNLGFIYQNKLSNFDII